MPFKRVAWVALAAAAGLAMACGGGRGNPQTGETNPAPAGTLTPAQEGQRVSQAQGCLSCHSITGETLVGPTWKGVWGKTVPMANGSTAVVDEAYVRESILEPNARIAKGFSPGIMPSFRGLISDQDLQHLIDYLKTLK